MKPGNSWVGSNRGAVATYDVNDNSANFISSYYASTDYNIRKYTINNNDINDYPLNGDYYGPGELYVNKTTDEDGNIALDFIDKNQRKVAVMNYMQLPQSASYKYFHITYYVYDDLGHLRVVIPPNVSDDNGNYGTIEDDMMDGYLYRYWYNEKGLLAERKLPGKAIEHFVYDQKDRLVLTTDDDLLTNQHKWFYTIYDCLDRVVFTGYAMRYNYTPAQWNTILNDPATYYDQSPSKLFHYLLKDTYHEYPDIYNYEDPDKLNVINYYDDYTGPDYYNYYGTFLKDGDFGSFTGNPLNAAIPAQSPFTKGLLTGQQIKIQDPNNPFAWTDKILFYNDKGQVIQTNEELYRGDVTTSYQYDFAGTLVSSITDRYDYSSISPGSTKIAKKYIKDYVTGQITGIEQQINGGSFTTIYHSTTDDLGRVKSKDLNVTTNNYSYNIQNSLTGINAADLGNASATDKYFFEQLSYDHGFTKPSYNGNIAGTTWRNAGSTTKQRVYGYSYDNANRLVAAEFGQQDVANSWSKIQTDYSVSGIGYDNNGNLYSMKQRGTDNYGSSTFIDNLTYQYANYSNKLTDVTDNGTVTAQNPDFKNGNPTNSQDYAYDARGNLIKDANKKISAVTYSDQNKPTHIVVDAKGSVDYVYDGLGNKLKKIVHSNTAPDDVTQYEGDFVYHNDVLQYIAHEEGRCRPYSAASPNGAFHYDYFIKDHLGNVRTTVNAEAATTPNLDYTVDMETSASVAEQAVWNNLPNVRVDKPYSTSTMDAKCAQTLGTNPSRIIGPATVIRVMPGDAFSLSCETEYEPLTPDFEPFWNSTNDLLDVLMGTLTSGGGMVGSGAVEAQRIQSFYLTNTNYGYNVYDAYGDVLFQYELFGADRIS